MGFEDTDLTRGIDAPKSDAHDIVARALDGVESGDDEVLADEATRQVKRSLAEASPAYLAAA